MHLSCAAILIGLLLGSQPFAQVNLFQHTGTSSKTLGNFGQSVNDLSDINGDGFADLVIGDPDHDDRSGRAVVYSGKDGTQLFEWFGPVASDFGRSVSSAGDVNGDEIEDIVIGAPGTEQIFVFCGMTGATVLIANAPTTGQFGFAVGSLDDVNDDGLADVLVGAPHTAHQGIDRGSAYIISGADGSVLLRQQGSTRGGKFGYAVHHTGDLDSDGTIDFIVGEPENNFTNEGLSNAFSGAAWVYSGRDGQLLYRLDNADDFSQRTGFGYAVTGGADLNADNIPDYAIGAPFYFNGVVFGAFSARGMVRVYSGADGSVLQEIQGTSVIDLFGASVDLTPDMTGDGRADLVIGAPKIISDVNPSLALEFAQESGYVKAIDSAGDELMIFYPGGNLASQVGSSVSGIPDLNGDGRAEVIVGAPYDDGIWGGPGKATVVSVVPPLRFSADTISTAAGATIDVQLTASYSLAGTSYILLGSATGKTPATYLGDDFYVLLAQDAYFDLTLSQPFGGLFAAGLGTFNEQGLATTQLNWPAGLGTDLVGTTLWHLSVAFDPLSFSPLFKTLPQTLTLDP